MQKKLSRKIQSFENLAFIRKKHLFFPHKKLRQLETTIPSLEEANKLDKYLGDLHRWRKESKQHKLQSTYDQNCRIFVSLKKQKSEYKLPKGIVSKKHSHIKLAPLTERTLNRAEGSQLSKIQTPRCDVPI